MATALTRAEGGFVVGASCPGCGGEVELSQDFFVTGCRHCGSILRVLVPQTPPAYVARPKVNAAQARAAFDRYLKEQDRPLTGLSCTTHEILYPYWKLDALALKVRTVTDEIPSHSEDQTACARESGTRTRRTVALSSFAVTVAAGPPDPAIPATIGLRADYLKLRPFESGDEPADYSVVPIVIDGAVALRRIQFSAKTMDGLGNTPGGGQHRTDLVGTRGSVIYVPYVVLDSGGEQPLRAVVDAITGRVVSCGAAVFDNSVPPVRSAPLGRVGLELHRCTTCGEDLPAKPSLVYCCRNCGKIILLGGAHGTVLRCAPHTEDDLLVPFWRCCNSIVPAFRMSNAEAMYRLSKRVSRTDGKISFDASISSVSRLAPAGMTPGEAAAIDQIIAFRKKIESDPLVSFQPSANVNPPTELLFIPFRPRDYFWVDSILDVITFERALLR